MTNNNDNILNNIDRGQTWIDVETVAKLKGITKRGVRLSLNQNKYEYKVENTRGGKTYKIKLSTLEEEYQIKYIQEYYDDFKHIDNEVIELNNFDVLYIEDFVIFVNDVIPGFIVGIDTYISKMVDKLRNNNKDIFDETDKYLIELNTQEENKLIELSDKSLIIREKDGLKFGIVFGNKFLSIIGNTLCNRHPELDYMLLIDPLEKKVSLRSVRIDVSKVAESYGGGGHKYAAGFSLNEEIFKSLLKIIINSDK